MSNYEDLIKQREILDQQIQTIKENEKIAAVQTIKALIEKHDITSSDLFSKKPGNTTKKVPAKYRNPASGETWTGRGKAPVWIAGKQRESFLI